MDNQRTTPATRHRQDATGVQAERFASLVTYAGVDADSRDAVRLVNISEGGLLVHTPRAAAVGDPRSFDFEVGNASGLLTLAGRVMHVMSISSGDAQTVVIGLAFFETLPQEQRAAIVALLRAD